MGEFVTTGRIKDWNGVQIRTAAPLHGNAGGAPEYYVPDPTTQVDFHFYGSRPKAVLRTIVSEPLTREERALVARTLRQRGVRGPIRIPKKMSGDEITVILDAADAPLITQEDLRLEVGEPLDRKSMVTTYGPNWYDITEPLEEA
jgi:hypothetical protein